MKEENETNKKEETLPNWIDRFLYGESGYSKQFSILFLKTYFHSGAKLKSKDGVNFLILQLTILKKVNQNLHEHGKSHQPLTYKYCPC